MCIRDRGNGSTEGVDQNLELTESEVDTEFTDRDKEGTYDAEEEVMITLDGDSIRAESGSVEITENTLTITGEGVYHITGTLSSGQIVVDAGDSDKVQIVLDLSLIHICRETYETAGYVLDVNGNTMRIDEENIGGRTYGGEGEDRAVEYNIGMAIVDCPVIIKSGLSVEVEYYVEDGVNYAVHIYSDGDEKEPIG